MMLRQLGKQTFRRVGLEVGKLRNVPFGINPFDDVAALARGVSVAFDVGANEGQTVAKMRRSFPTARIFSFEPVPSTFAILTANVAGYRDVECIQSAVGEYEGEVTITESKTSGHNTVNLSAKPDSPTLSVPATTVDAFAKRRGIDAIDLLKIDTEGYETQVLKGATGMLESGSIRFVLAECEFSANPNEPHGLFFDIAATLLPLGYRVGAFYAGGVDGNGWHWGDVLFMRPQPAQRDVICSPYAVDG